jgi:hypothetical protein
LRQRPFLATRESDREIVLVNLSGGPTDRQRLEENAEALLCLRIDGQR